MIWMSTFYIANKIKERNHNVHGPLHVDEIPTQAFKLSSNLSWTGHGLVKTPLGAHVRYQ